MDNSLLATCRFPALPRRYQQALHKATAYICARFEPIGIIASGTIIRGKPDSTSDLDIIVIHQLPTRQRIQRFFDGVAAELFVNPPYQIEEYYRTEHEAGRPVTAHMLATGFVILNRAPIIAELQRTAHQMLATPPNYSDQHLTMLRYGAATFYEDALDVLSIDPATAQFLLTRAVDAMLGFVIKSAGEFLPRSKELLKAVTALDSQMGTLVRDFFEANTLEKRLQIAEQLAACTIETRGFFEWESEPEECSRPSEPIPGGRPS